MAKRRLRSRVGSVWEQGAPVKFFVDDDFYVTIDENGIHCTRKSDGRVFHNGWAFSWFEATGVKKTNKQLNYRVNNLADRFRLIKP